MLKLTFTKVPRKGPGLGQSWTHTVEPPDDDMMAEYLGLSPRSQYLYRYGWKQKLVDSTSDCTSESAFVGAVDKNRDSVVNGTVNDRDGAVAAPVKTPIEREIEKLATAEIRKIIKGTANESMPHDRFVAYVELYIENHDDELRTKAKANLSGMVKVRAVSKDDLDALIRAAIPATESPPVKGKDKKAA